MHILKCMSFQLKKMTNYHESRRDNDDELLWTCDKYTLGLIPRAECSHPSYSNCEAYECQPEDTIPKAANICQIKSGNK